MSLVPSDHEGWDRWFFGGTPGPDEAIASAMDGALLGSLAKPDRLDASRGRHTIQQTVQDSQRAQHGARHPWRLRALMACGLSLGILAQHLHALHSNTPPPESPPREFLWLRTSCQALAQDASRLHCRALPAPTTRMGTQSPPVHT